MLDDVPDLLERLGEAVPENFGPLREHCRISEPERLAAQVLADRHTATLRLEIQESEKGHGESV